MGETPLNASRSPWLIAAALTTLAFAIRLALSLKGSIWADEGLVLNIVGIPSWREMIDFIARHESHPPLFYLMVRAWGALVGGGVTEGLVMTSLLGALVVPATGWAAAVVSSRSVAILAMVLAAFSPSLAEHASQLRPYGLLPVLAVISTATLYDSLRSGNRWAAYVTSTVLLVFTHHWGWLIVAGHAGAGVWLVGRLDRPRLRAAGEWAVAGASVLIAYGFWLRPLLFQVANTGHLPTIHEGRNLAGYFVFAILNLPRMFWATYPPTLLPSVLIGAAAAMVIAVAARKWIVRQRLDERDGRPASAPSAVVFMVACGGIPLLIALGLSPRSNMLLDRCVVAVVPVFVIAASIGLVRVQRSVPAAAVALAAFAVAAGFANIVGLASSRRSNAREVASLVIRDRRPGDVVIVVPEWIAPSFNYYFPASRQQIDFPHPGRSGLLDFAQFRDKMLDTAALDRVAGIATETANNGKRVWLVTARRFLTFTDEIVPTLPAATRARAVSALELDGVRAHLTKHHGRPDTTRTPVAGDVARYEELVVMLFDRNTTSGTR